MGTVVRTWTSAPRPPQSLMIVRDDGQVAGSVSGGCIEDDLIGRVASAELAVTHDPKLDNLALLEALRTPAFYVGALGSLQNNARRRERLLEFDVSPEEAAMMHGPVGLNLGALTPPEIASFSFRAAWRLKIGSFCDGHLRMRQTSTATPAKPGVSQRTRLGRSNLLGR
jgi:xanthine/CO dehydrogenase XdhC/CoxF family maturation factor